MLQGIDEGQMDRIVAKMQICNAGVEELTKAGVKSSKTEAGYSFSSVYRDEVEIVALSL